MLVDRWRLSGSVQNEADIQREADSEMFIRYAGAFYLQTI